MSLSLLLDMVVEDTVNRTIQRLQEESGTPVVLTEEGVRSYIYAMRSHVSEDLGLDHVENGQIVSASERSEFVRDHFEIKTPAYDEKRIFYATLNRPAMLKIKDMVHKFCDPIEGSTWFDFDVERPKPNLIQKYPRRQNGTVLYFQAKFKRLIKEAEEKAQAKKFKESNKPESHQESQNPPNDPYDLTNLKREVEEGVQFDDTAPLMDDKSLKLTPGLDQSSIPIKTEKSPMRATGAIPKVPMTQKRGKKRAAIFIGEDLFQHQIKQHQLQREAAKRTHTLLSDRDEFLSCTYQMELAPFITGDVNGKHPRGTPMGFLQTGIYPEYMKSDVPTILAKMRIEKENKI